MTRNKAARNSGNYSRANVLCRDKRIITCDVLLGVAGALVMLGIPTIMAALKAMGVW